MSKITRKKELRENQKRLLREITDAQLSTEINVEFRKGGAFAQGGLPGLGKKR
jgi:hypothetical protein